MKVFTQKRNPLTGGTEWDMQDEDYDYHQEIARSAFADMLHDTERNKKYHRALLLAVQKMHGLGKKANVLDIGTGTGLLSIMAVKCGADTVTACEAFKPMADCCAKILQRNGVADRIKLIPKRSTEIVIGEDGDMKEKANILVTEVFDTELIGEGALSTFSHAHKHLLEKDCIVIPDSAIIYAQVVECNTMNSWNKVDDFEDYGVKTPSKMKSCPGAASVHDLQLSQLSLDSFRPLSDQIPVFYYDWSGKAPLQMSRTVRQQFNVIDTGKAQMVFMWWDLNMDTEGKITLSCAPWWWHDSTPSGALRPADSLPWRDHWMQAIYYLPTPQPLRKNTDSTLVAFQDEYSFWFYVGSEETNNMKQFKRPICECGVHMALSRTHLGYLNDRKLRQIFAERVQKDLTSESVVLDLNPMNFLGLYAAKTAKKVYFIENQNLNLGILQDFVKENQLSNVEMLPDVDDDICSEITNVICDPNYPTAILPWENLKVAYLLYRHKSLLKKASVIPEGFELWCVPIQLKDLQKIRIPLGSCEGIDMSIFDDLVENSRIISDTEIEAQPLWEYPGFCSGLPRKLLDINLTDLNPAYLAKGTFTVNDPACDSSYQVNAFALWCAWRVGGRSVSGGPRAPPAAGQLLKWSPHARQAVKILKATQTKKSGDDWMYTVDCDLEKGKFNVSVDLVGIL